MELNDVEFVNLLTHPIVILNEDGEKVLEVPPSGEVATVDTSSEVAGRYNGVPVIKREHGEVKGVPTTQCGNCRKASRGCTTWSYFLSCPEMVPRKVYIVSPEVLNAFASRNDLVAPDVEVLPDNPKEPVIAKAFRRL